MRHSINKILQVVAAEKTQMLRSLAAFPEGLSSIPSIPLGSSQAYVTPVTDPSSGLS